MTSLEGERGYPRVKPPFPAQSRRVGHADHDQQRRDAGLRAARSSSAAASGSPRIGPDAKNSGPKLYCLSGHVKRPGVYEAPMGLPADGADQRPGRRDAARRPAAQGLHPRRLLGAGAARRRVRRQPGLRLAGQGRLGARLGRASWSWTARPAWSRRCCASRTSTPTSPAASARRAAQGTRLDGAASSSGSSTAGAGSEDLDLLVDVADNIEGNTICALGDAAAWPVQSFVKKFRDEFEAHVDARKVCGACRNAEADD